MGKDHQPAIAIAQTAHTMKDTVTTAANTSTTGNPTASGSSVHVAVDGSSESSSEFPLSRRELKQLMKRSNVPGLIHLGIWLALLALTTTGVYLSYDAGWWLLPALLLHGLLLVHHFPILHECTHFTAFRSRRLCLALTRICGFLLILPPLHFRYEHCDHHTYTNLRGHDPELIELPESRAGYLLYLSGLPYWYYNIGGLVRRAFGTLTDAEKVFIPRSERQAVLNESRLMGAAYLGIVGFMLISGSTAPFWYWWLPMVLAEPVMRYTRMTEHVGRPTTDDRFENVRTNVVSLPWRFLAWNMNYHAEHHYASSVPFHRLGDLHEKLGDRLTVVHDGYRGSHRDILQRIVQRQASRG